MRRIIGLIALGLLVSVGARAQDVETATGTALSGADSSLPFVVDLSPYYVNKFKPAVEGGSNVCQVVDGLTFEMGGEVILYGKSDADRDGVYRTQVKGIKIGRKFDELHLMHSVRWREYYGCPVAILRLNYADGTRHDMEIRYNFQVLDWNRLLSEEREILDDPDTKIIKRGGGGAWKGTGRQFKSMLKNPFPDKDVVSMDILSTRSRASYKLNAATVAKRDPYREVTAALPLNQPEYHFEGSVKVWVVDNETGAPVAGADVNPYMSVEDVGVVADPILTSRDGVALVKYPISRTSYVGIRVTKEGYLECGDHWKNENIPNSITYRLVMAPVSKEYHLVQTQMLDSCPDGKMPQTVYVLVMPDETRPQVFQTFGSKEMETRLSNLPRRSVVRYDANGFLSPVEAAQLEALKTCCQKKGVRFVQSNVN